MKALSNSLPNSVAVLVLVAAAYGCAREPSDETGARAYTESVDASRNALVRAAPVAAPVKVAARATKAEKRRELEAAPAATLEPRPVATEAAPVTTAEQPPAEQPPAEKPPAEPQKQAEAERKDETKDEVTATQPSWPAANDYPFPVVTYVYPAVGGVVAAAGGGFVGVPGSAIGGVPGAFPILQPGVSINIGGESAFMASGQFAVTTSALRTDIESNAVARELGGVPQTAAGAVSPTEAGAIPATAAGETTPTVPGALPATIAGGSPASVAGASPSSIAGDVPPTQAGDLLPVEGGTLVPTQAGALPPTVAGDVSPSFGAGFISPSLGAGAISPSAGAGGISQ